jgi:hypothetical protein
MEDYLFSCDDTPKSPGESCVFGLGIDGCPAAGQPNGFRLAPLASAEWTPCPGYLTPLEAIWTTLSNANVTGCEGSARMRRLAPVSYG